MGDFCRANRTFVVFDGLGDFFVIFVVALFRFLFQLYLCKSDHYWISV